MKKRIFVCSVIILLCLSNYISAEEHQSPEIPRISAIVAYEKFKTGKSIIVDAMNEQTYKKYHILGAISMPNDGPADRQRIRDRGVEFPPNTEIIAYCD
jgi:rhodanese-related sulfurtransferase